MKLHPEIAFLIGKESSPVNSRHVSAGEEEESTHTTQIFCTGHYHSTLI